MKYNQNTNHYTLCRIMFISQFIKATLVIRDYSIINAFKMNFRKVCFRKMRTKNETTQNDDSLKNI